MSKPDWMQSPYDEGFHARQRGEPATNNPHRVGSIDRQQWRSGWLDLERHLNARDAAWEQTFGRGIHE